jgi:hypothetical protein
MKNIAIKQDGRHCGLWHGDELILIAGRVEVKRRAKALHLQTGDPVYNIKKGGALVLVHSRKEVA